MNEEILDRVSELAEETEMYRALPPGTLIQEPSGIRLFKTKHNGWISEDFVRRSSVNVQRPVTILYKGD